MASRSKRLKKWLLDFISPKDEILYMPDGPQRRGGEGGLMSHAQGFAIYNSPMTSVQGNQYTTYVQEDRNIVPQIMYLLSQHIIRGAAHDSSARTPPPRCHPDTRVKLIARITSWFEGEGPQELLLWITGPAGVGKSAIVQTFAEYLAKSQLLGASVFISRPNKRNNPHGIFITVAYQLAVRIEAYRHFIVERLSFDPELLRGDMRAQFTAFIVEPFVEKKIETGGKRWGVFLDGLDELDGEDAQCNIIQLISTFIHDHRDAPLVWIIASRPESHISNTFDDDEVRGSYWSEYIPIDSTEACKDVENFLRSGFETIRKKFQHSVPRDWPSDTDFLKLAVAASGLFVYAEVVMGFIRDSDLADPVSQLEILLSTIDRSNAVPTTDNPFVHLDELYKEILSSIPSTHWPTAKLLLAFTIHAEAYSGLKQSLRTLRGTSILLGINRRLVYACLNKLRSTLKIPDWEVAHKQSLTFLHASFSDYLSDSTRSGDFCVSDRLDTAQNVNPRLLETWNLCSGDEISTASVEHTWHQYCSKWDDKKPPKAVSKFHAELFRDYVNYVAKILCSESISRVSPTHEQLCRVDMIKLCDCFDAVDVMYLVYHLPSINYHQDPLLGNEGTGFLRLTQLRDLKLGDLDWEEMSPARAHYRKTKDFSMKNSLVLLRPRSSAELEAFVSDLERLQERLPELEVVIAGAVPKRRVATIYCPLKEPIISVEDYVYYIIPFTE